MLPLIALGAMIGLAIHYKRKQHQREKLIQQWRKDHASELPNTGPCSSAGHAPRDTTPPNTRPDTPTGTRQPETISSSEGEAEFFPASSWND